MTLARAGGSRWSAIGVTIALHLLLAALFLLRPADRAPEANARWIEVVGAPAQPGPAARESLPRRVQPRPGARGKQAGSAAPSLPQEAPVALPPAPALPDPLFADQPPAPAGLLERARAEAGNVARGLQKEFPEHPNRLRARERTAQQKLASGIVNALAPPKLYQAPRITAIQDQGVGWGRRIDKVVTGMGTYCITHESNHGGDGRDVFKDALEPKIRTCPREE